jgi:hypothetical protein
MRQPKRAEQQQLELSEREKSGFYVGELKLKRATPRSSGQPTNKPILFFFFFFLFLQFFDDLILGIQVWRSWKVPGCEILLRKGPHLRHKLARWCCQQNKQKSNRKIDRKNRSEKSIGKIEKNKKQKVIGQKEKNV